jgi:hypothetical protein
MFYVYSLLKWKKENRERESNLLIAMQWSARIPGADPDVGWLCIKQRKKDGAKD